MKRLSRVENFTWCGKNRRVSNNQGIVGVMMLRGHIAALCVVGRAAWN